jgi:hypothetical protein
MATKAGRDSRTQAAQHPSWFRPVAGGIELSLHVQPGARRSRLVGEHGDRLKVAVSAPATDGRANTALLALLAERLALPRSALQLVAGASSREKRVRISVSDGSAQTIAALLLATSRPDQAPK